MAIFFTPITASDHVLFAGLCILFIGHFWLLIRALEVSLRSCLIVLLVPIMIPFFIRDNWDIAKYPAIVWLFGLSMIFLHKFADYL